jgi:hypothetical protein
MPRKKSRNKIDVEGLVCYADDDPLAEVSIVTDYGHELFVDPVGPMNNPADWIDSLVHVKGRMVKRDGRRYLRVDRINRVQDEWGALPDDTEGWPIGRYSWDDNEDEHEDHY